MKPNDLEGALHAEIERLPERYRAPVVLCNLEGCSHQQAARHLGWPVGTVKSRQARREGKTPRPPSPSWSLTRRCLTRQRPSVQEPQSSCLARIGGINHPLGRSICHVADRQERVRSLTRAGGYQSHVIRPLVEDRFRSVRASGDRFRRRNVCAEASAAARLDAGNPAEKTRPDEPRMLWVTPGRLDLTIIEPARLEMARANDAFCRVEGGSTIIQIVPDATFVKKGDTICELDSAALRDQLTNTQIAIKSAEVDYRNATAIREIAEIAVREFLEGTYKNELNAIRGEAALAESNIQKGERRLERGRHAGSSLATCWLRKRVRSRPRTSSPGSTSKIGSTRPSRPLRARSRRLSSPGPDRASSRTLPETGRSSRFRSRRRENGPTSWPSATAGRSSKPRRGSSRLKSPRARSRRAVDGTVVYANPPRSRPNQLTLSQIEEGALVREHQKIFSVIDPNGQKRATARVRESQVDKIRRRMKARVRVDGFPTQLFYGIVDEVAALPDAHADTRVYSKVYTTHVLLDNEVPGPAPGYDGRSRIPSGQSRKRDRRARPGNPSLRGEAACRRSKARRRYRLTRRECGPFQRQAHRDHPGNRQRRRRDLESHRILE